MDGWYACNIPDTCARVCVCASHSVPDCQFIHAVSLMCCVLGSLLVSIWLIARLHALAMSLARYWLFPVWCGPALDLAEVCSEMTRLGYDVTTGATQLGAVSQCVSLTLSSRVRPGTLGVPPSDAGSA